MSTRIGFSQHVMDLADRGERRDTLDQAWARLAQRLGAVPVAIPNQLDDPVAFAHDLALDLVVLTGGNDLASLPGAAHPAPERDRTERALIDHALAGGIPLLGVCRGLQHLAHATGGALHRVSGHVASEHTLIVDTPEWPIADGRTVNSFHSWGLTADALGTALVPLARCADGTVEAATIPGLPILGIMWHPERGDDEADLELIAGLLGGTAP